MIPEFTAGRIASLSIVFYQHSIQLMIGREIYPAATFGFSITFNTVLHLGHIMVLPWYPSFATLRITVCLSLGSPLYINVLPQSGTGQRAMGMRFIVFSIGNSCFYRLSPIKKHTINYELIRKYLFDSHNMFNSFFEYIHRIFHCIETHFLDYLKTDKKSIQGNNRFDSEYYQIFLAFPLLPASL